MSNRMLVLLMGFVGVLIVVVGIVFIAVLASSGGDDDGDSAPADSSDEEEEDGDNPSTASGICAEDNLITFGSDPLTTLDPIQVRDEGTAEYVIEIFGGLVTLDLDLNVVPDIAEDWEVSDDGTLYTFHLRDDVVFHNQRRVTAEDFKYSFERAADPANNSPTVMLYLGAIQGLEERFEGTAEEISGVRVVDDRTLEIELDAPRPVFLAELTYPVAFVVDREQVEADPRDWTRSPNGTGPFKLKRFAPAEEIILVRNEEYHLGPPLLEEVQFALAGGSLLTRYENDEIHVALVPAIELEPIQDGTDPLSEDYKPQERMTVTYLAFNENQPPFDDPLVRQAFAMAINRDELNELLAFGTQHVADGITPPQTPGYDESVASLEYNPEEAQALLAQSSYADDMPRVILTYGGTGGNSPDFLVAIQQQIQEVLGVEIELEANDPSAFLRELRNGTFQMFNAGWAADYPDAEDFVDKLFASDSIQNEFGYENEDVDELIFEARTEMDNEARYALLAEAEQIILDDAIVVPMFWPVEHLLVKPCVQNWPTLPMSVPKYRYIDIAED